MGKHTAHGYLVEDVYKEAEKFTKLFGFKPARIDETFAGFPMEGKVEFFEKYYPRNAKWIKDFWMPNKSWEGCNGKSEISGPTGNSM